MMTTKKKKTMTTKRSTPHATKRSTKKPARAAVLHMSELKKRVRVALTAQLGAPVAAPEPVAPVLVVEENAPVAPVLPVPPVVLTAARTDGRVRSEATKLGAKAVGYLRRHARHPYGVRGCEGIVSIAREAWRAALVELEAAS